MPLDCAILRPAFRMTACILWDVLCQKSRNIDAQSLLLILGWFGLLLSLICFIVKLTLKSNCTNWSYHNHSKHALLQPLMQYGHIYQLARVFENEIYIQPKMSFTTYSVHSGIITLFNLRTRRRERQGMPSGVRWTTVSILTKKYHEIGDMLSMWNDDIGPTEGCSNCWQQVKRRRHTV